MKIVIGGAGEVGTHLAKMLSNENQDIILIDSDQTRLDIIDQNYNLMTWNGSPSSFGSLRDVGISDADLFVAVTPYETRNITSCSIAKRLGAKKTVARIDNSEFLKEENRSVLRDMGVDFMIYPENIAANEISTALEHTWTRYWGEMHGGKLLLIGIKLHDGTPLINCKISQMPVTAHHFHIVAIKRDNETIIPGGNDTILKNDIIFVVTTPEYVEEVRELCGKKKYNVRKVMIVGGGRITRRFATLYSHKYNIKIIDNNRENCEEMATALPDCEIVCGDGRDIELLRENNVYQYDAFLALTPYSETNILSCLTAKEFGVHKTIADVENLQFISQADNLNIGTTINKKLVASSRIFKILLDADESSAKCLALADAEVAEIQVKPGAKITGKAVKDLHLPFGMTLAGLMREGKCSLISGATVIEPGDFVVVLCLTGTINKIEKWFN